MRTCLLTFIAILFGLMVRPVHSQAPNQAGVVVEYGDGSIRTACVTFTEPQITGLELLSRTGLPLTYEMQGGGALMCSIGGVGCNFPAQGCLCQCAGIGTCNYWSSHSLQPDGGWAYSGRGASSTIVTDGSVEGWRWGAGGANDAAPPPTVRFDEICAALPAPTTTTMTSATLTPPATPAAPSASPTVTPAALPTDSPRPAVVAWARTVAPLLIVVVLAAIVIWVRRNQKP